MTWVGQLCGRVGPICSTCVSSSRHARRIPSGDQVTFAARSHQSAVALVEGVARAIDDGLTGDAAISAVLVARYAAQRALRAAADMASELLGGIAFMRSPDIGYLVAAVRPLAYHPPSRTAMAQALIDYFTGQPLRLS